MQTSEYIYLFASHIELEITKQSKIKNNKTNFTTISDTMQYDKS